MARLNPIYNDAAIGLDMIYEAAAAGHPGAEEVLRAMAERLVAEGAKWRDAKYRARQDRKGRRS